VDTIEFSTSNGLKKIELMFGDITSLKSVQAVDLLMVSASKSEYRGSYKNRKLGSHLG